MAEEEKQKQAQSVVLVDEIQRRVESGRCCGLAESACLRQTFMP